jgi:hypothetical protein
VYRDGSVESYVPYERLAVPRGALLAATAGVCVGVCVCLRSTDGYAVSNTVSNNLNACFDMNATADCRDDRLLSEAAAAAVGGVMPENISPSQRYRMLCCVAGRASTTYPPLQMRSTPFNYLFLFMCFLKYVTHLLSYLFTISRIIMLTLTKRNILIFFSCSSDEKGLPKKSGFPFISQNGNVIRKRCSRYVCCMHTMIVILIIELFISSHL